MLLVWLERSSPSFLPRILQHHLQLNEINEFPSLLCQVVSLSRHHFNQFLYRLLHQIINHQKSQKIQQYTMMPLQRRRRRRRRRRRKHLQIAHLLPPLQNSRLLQSSPRKRSHLCLLLFGSFECNVFPFNLRS